MADPTTSSATVEAGGADRFEPTGASDPAGGHDVAWPRIARTTRREGGSFGQVQWPPQRLTVVYDEECELCRRCRHWLSAQSTHVELAFLAAGSEQGRALYGTTPWYRTELMVVADTGHAWVGPTAFIMCLWATRGWRNTSYRLRGRAFAPMAERFFHSLSANRPAISSMLSSHRCDDGACQRPSQGEHSSAASPGNTAFRQPV